MKYLILLILLFIPILGVNAETISIDSVFEQAEQSYFDLRISKIDIDISRASIREAKADYYPTLSVGYNNEYNRDMYNNGNNVSSVGNIVVNNETRFQNLISTKFEYGLIDYGIRGKILDSAKKDLIQKECTYNQKLRDIKLQLMDSYTKALVDYVDIKDKEQILPVYNELFETKERLYQSGTAPKLEIMNEAIKIARITDSIEQAKTSLSSNLSDISSLTLVKYEPKTELKTFEPDEELIKPETKTLLFKQSVEQEVFIPNKTFEFQIYQMEMEKKANELAVLKRQRFPIFKIYTSYLVYGSDPSNYLRAFENLRSRNIAFGISASLPIFDGFKNAAQRQKTLLEIEKLKLEQEKYSYEIKSKFDKLYDYYKSLQNELKTKEVVVTTNTEKLNALSRLFSQGMIDKATLLDHQAETLTQQLELKKTRIRLSSTLKQLEILLEGF